MSLWDDEAGYDLDDPKHPTYLDRYADVIDLRRKREKEDEHEAEFRRKQAAAIDPSKIAFPE